MQSYFGVTEAQSQASGYSNFSPSAGNKQSSLDLQAKYKFSKNIIFGLEYIDLSFQNDAAKSPLVISSHNQIYSVFIGFRP